MTKVLITVDTELSAGRQGRGLSARANFESSILARCGDGDFGVGWQMDQLEAHQLKGVFFVDPMPALVHGEQIVADIVGPIVDRGHEVQLHIHTEWLQWAERSPVGGRLGRNLADFSMEDQIVLLGIARDLLTRAGAPRPNAFRAGNYGADDNSIKALAVHGISWDTSVNAAYLNTDCRVSVDAGQISAIERDGVVVLPVSGLHDVPGHFRPAQICAISAAEMRAALRHAATSDHPAFVVVTHSFEMLSRDRARPNHVVTARFEKLCRLVSEHPLLECAGFFDLDAGDALRKQGKPERLPASRAPTAARLAEQMMANLRYERRLTPA